MKRTLVIKQFHDDMDYREAYSKPIDAQEALITYFIGTPRAARDIKWIMGWNDKKTISENCKNLKIPNFTTGCNLCRKYGLGFREGYHRIIRTNQESLMILKKNGLTDSEIARLLNVSPQRISQILNKKWNKK
jgi:hypothetical protein